MKLWATIALLSLNILGSACLPQHTESSLAASGVTQQVTLDIDLSQTHSVSELLYGIFFEEINHAGDGGLYAELVNDRSFDGLAHATGFRASPSATLQLSDKLLEQGADSLRAQTARQAHAHSEGLDLDRPSNDPFPWSTAGNATTTLTKDDPLTPTNAIAMIVEAHEPLTGLDNDGYWGIPVEEGTGYYLSLFLRADSNATANKKQVLSRVFAEVLVVLRSSDGKKVYAAASFGVNGTDWTRHEATLKANGTDYGAVLSVLLVKPGSVAVDTVSLFPAENRREKAQNPWPFRRDILDLLKQLKPRFLRVPGGCYIEGGDHLSDAFMWKTALGPMEERPGHMNANWGYWSTDGLGIYEYLQMAEAVDAEPIWVVNNGISHREGLPPSQVGGWLQDALDAIEFVRGDADSKWGAERAAMGRKHPWNLTYVAIGNEDCGHQYYIENYRLFFDTIRKAYPDMRLISNCNLGNAVPRDQQDIWDWHSYPDSWNMFAMRHEFDHLVPGKDPYVFASEYAVTPDGGWGNLRAAVAEAAFMTGMERNSEVVALAAYAPLLVNINNHMWRTNLIVFDNHQVYKTPSYLVQELFSMYQGVRYAKTDVTVTSGEVHEELTAASTTCLDAKCRSIALKVANFASFSQMATVRVKDMLPLREGTAATLHVIQGPNPEAENTFDAPENIVTVTADFAVRALFRTGYSEFALPLGPWSVSCLVFELEPLSRGAAEGSATSALA